MLADGVRDEGNKVILTIALWPAMMVSDSCILSPTRNSRREVQEASRKQQSVRELHRQWVGDGFLVSDVILRTGIFSQ